MITAASAIAGRNRRSVTTNRNRWPASRPRCRIGPRSMSPRRWRGCASVTRICLSTMSAIPSAARPLGLLANNGEVSRALLIASQAGYWKLMASPERYRVYAMLNFFCTPLTRLLGYAPGWSGLGEDLPKGVFEEWVSWVMSKRYLFDDPKLGGLKNFPQFNGAMRALCFSDDPWATRPAVELLCAGFVSANPEIPTITPADAGVTRIRHFGFFRPDHREPLGRGAR